MEVNVLYLTLLEDKKKFEISVGFFGSQTHDRLKVASWIHSTSVFSCPQSPAGLAFIEGRGVCSPFLQCPTYLKWKAEIFISHKNSSSSILRMTMEQASGCNHWWWWKMSTAVECHHGKKWDCCQKVYSALLRPHRRQRFLEAHLV